MKFFVAIAFLLSFLISCQKEGCTDESATNFDANADINDGSCVYNNSGNVDTDESDDTNEDGDTDKEIESKPGTGVTFDGYTYTSIILGNGQEWMVENLRANKYCNGDSIPNIKDSDEWESLTNGAWSHYANNVQNEEAFGKLYNWYSVEDDRNICPCGWHVPSNDEWNNLIDYLGGQVKAGGKLKSTDTLYWNSPNHYASNKIGFYGLPGGTRFNGNFVDRGLHGLFWSSTEYYPPSVRGFGLGQQIEHIFRKDVNKKRGMSVRCIKD